MRRFVPLLFAPALLLAAEPSYVCHRPLDSTAAYRGASANAERIAPSDASKRRRSVDPPDAAQQALPAVNFIDDDLFAAQKAAGIVPTTLASDEEFLRRITLDLTGQIPDPAAVTAFIADTAADKRAKKIDELLASDAFVDRWTMWFGDLVQNVQVSSNAREYYLGRNAYYNWIKDSIRAAKPYDQMVRELIAGKGDSFTSGASNYVVRQLQPNGPPQDALDNLAAHSGEKFLGMPLLCLSCHDGQGHLELVNQGLKSKTRAQFWGMSAFFARTRVNGSRYSDPNFPNANPIRFDITDANAGEYRLNTTSGNKTPRAPATGQSDVVAPAYMFTGEGPRAGEPRRDAYGRILTADRQFARAAVNYLWKEMFGIGIVEPVNAFDLAKLQTQATNPALLEHLTDAFIASGYSLRSILKTIAMSSSYQLSSKYTPGAWSETWTTYFPRHYPRRMSAEMIFDAIVKATSVPANMNVVGLGAVTKAMQLPDPLEPRSPVGTFLNNFGRGDRDDTARTSDSSISQALAMLNDPIVVTRVRRQTPNSTVARTLAATSDPNAIAEQLWLATLSRKPTAEEKALAVAYLGTGATLPQRTEDLQFALINQLEFLFY